MNSFYSKADAIINFYNCSTFFINSLFKTGSVKHSPDLCQLKTWIEKLFYI